MIEAKGDEEYECGKEKKLHVCNVLDVRNCRYFKERAYSHTSIQENFGK